MALQVLSIHTCAYGHSHASEKDSVKQLDLAVLARMEGEA